LIKGLQINGSSQVWQSDITYIKVKDKYYYVVFIIDVYTRKIVGYNVSDNMRATSNIKALKMALKNNKAPLVHHSDRGSQYTYKAYTEMLIQNGSKISMGGSAQENAYVERLHRTIKEEYLDYWQTHSFVQLKKHIKKAVINYNTKRTHKGIGKLSPIDYEKNCNQNKIELNSILTIFNDELINKPVNSN
jgi:transposase InsO family protein